MESKMLYLEVKCELPTGQVGMSEQPPVTRLAAGRGQETERRGSSALEELRKARALPSLP